LFIDACRQRIDRIDNPLQLPDREVVASTAPSARCFFCLLAAGAAKAYETRRSARGIFTSVLLRHLADLRKTGGTVSTLAVRVRNDLVAKGVSQPEYCAIGTDDGWPLPRDSTPVQSKRGVEEVDRAVAAGIITDALASSDGRPVWFTGPSGAGKSVLVRQFSRSVNATYFSIEPDRATSTEEVLDALLGEVVEDSPGLFPSARRPPGKPQEVLRYVCERRPGSMIVIDHVDRLPPIERKQLAEAMLSLPVDVVLVGNIPAPRAVNVFVAECPPLSAEEVELFRRAYAPDAKIPAEMLWTVSGGWPLRLRALLISGATSVTEILDRAPVSGVRQAAHAIGVAGGYVDESSFRRHLKLDVDSLSWLERTGLVSFIADHYKAHDELAATQRGASRRLIQRVGAYWATQVRETPQHLWACRALLSFVARQGYRSSMDRAIRTAAEGLIRVNDWDILGRALTEVVRTCKRSSRAALYIAAEAAHISRHDIVDDVAAALEVLKPSSTVSNELNLILSERFFWSGDFSRAAELSCSVLASSNKPEFFARAHLNLAITRFFEGDWDAAMHELATFEKRSVKPRTRAWSQLIAGTVHALRGVDVLLGTQLLQRCIQVLTHIGDDVGAAIAWNNLGEIRWKLRDLRSALVCLGTALELARARGDRATELEAVRNLLHTHLRLHGPQSMEVLKLSETLEALLGEIADLTEHMQAWNTLATVALYQGDRDRAGVLISTAQPYTRGNAEYDIYTLANLSILHALNSCDAQAGKVMRDALGLAERGHNYLALYQMKGDIIAVSSLTRSSAVGDLVHNFNVLSPDTMTKVRALED
jgi:tetratricopeptide (TPR) repeat protein